MFPKAKRTRRRRRPSKEGRKIAFVLAAAANETTHQG